jgi:hypothetical protein
MPWSVWLGRLSVDGRTGHCPVRQPLYPTVRVRPLELWQLGPPDSHCSLSGAPSAPTLTLQALFAPCSRTVHLLQTTVGAVAIATHGTPDSPVLHRIVWWIIAEWHFQKPEAEQFRVELPGAPDTVRWCTGQSSAPDQGSLRLVLLLSFWTLSWTFYWFVLNLWHL